MSGHHRPVTTYGHYSVEPPPMLSGFHPVTGNHSTRHAPGPSSTNHSQYASLPPQPQYPVPPFQHHHTSTPTTLHPQYTTTPYRTLQPGCHPETGNPSPRPVPRAFHETASPYASSSFQYQHVSHQPPFQSQLAPPPPIPHRAGYHAMTGHPSQRHAPRALSTKRAQSVAHNPRGSGYPSETGKPNSRNARTTNYGSTTFHREAHYRKRHENEYKDEYKDEYGDEYKDDNEYVEREDEYEEDKEEEESEEEDEEEEEEEEEEVEEDVKGPRDPKYRRSKHENDPGYTYASKIGALCVENVTPLDRTQVQKLLTIGKEIAILEKTSPKKHDKFNDMFKILQSHFLGQWNEIEDVADVDLGASSDFPPQFSTIPVLVQGLGNKLLIQFNEDVMIQMGGGTKLDPKILLACLSLGLLEAAVYYARDNFHTSCKGDALSIRYRMMHLIYVASGLEQSTVYVDALKHANQRAVATTWTGCTRCDIHSYSPKCETLIKLKDLEKRREESLEEYGDLLESFRKRAASLK